jgi:hypothetical protein
MTDISIHEPERPVFVSDRAHRRRVLRAAGLTCAVLVALWVTAVVLGALGDPLPGLSVVSLKPSASPPPPLSSRPAAAPPRPVAATLPVAPAQTPAAKPLPAPASPRTVPVSYVTHPQQSAPARPPKRHPAVRHPAASRHNNGGVRPGRQLAARQHPIRRPHRPRRVSV